MILLNKLFKRILSKSAQPVVAIVFRATDLYKRLISLFYADQTLIKSEFNGGKILLLALFEKSKLRPDIINLITEAKKQGLFVICVNTQNLHSHEEYRGLIDIYIERFNYGRDFGSYKAGFNYIYKAKWQKKCSRVLVLNDSVFYSKSKLTSFLDSLAQSEHDVLGATENHRGTYHIGSFCFSLSQNIICNERVRKYWSKYKLSDIRPIVIERGEKKFNHVLKKCSSPKVLYNLAWLAKTTENNKPLITKIHRYYRETNIIPWNKPSLETVTIELFKKYLSNNENIIFRHEKLIGKGTFKQLTDILILAGFSKSDAEEIIYEEIRKDLLNNFSYESEIHHNAILLHQLGLAIIKLDLVHRGLCSPSDIEKFIPDLDEKDRDSFRKLMLSKRFGGDILIGFDRVAFDMGYI